MCASIVQSASTPASAHSIAAAPASPCSASTNGPAGRGGPATAPNAAVKLDVSDCNANGVDRIRITLLEYAGDPKLKQVAVSKVQFYKKG